METVYSFASATKITRQLVTVEGQIRYKLALDDMPLGSQDFCALMDAIEKDTRLEITLKAVSE